MTDRDFSSAPKKPFDALVWLRQCVQACEDVGDVIGAKRFRDCADEMERLRAALRRPDPLSQALNEGDGGVSAMSRDQYNQHSGLVAALRNWHEIKGWPHLRDAADTIERLEAENAELREKLKERE